MQIKTAPLFSGKTPALKRLKQYKKEEKQRLKTLQGEKEPARKLTRKERIAAYRAEKQKFEKARLADYQAALERYVADPTPVHEFLESPVYQDQEGDFTVRDLMDVMRSSEKKSKIAGYTFLGVAAALILPLPLAYLGHYINHGHEANAFKIEGTSGTYMLTHFPTKVHQEVWDAVHQMKTHGLISFVAVDGLNKFYAFTDLGKRLMK